jgi:hypothetical protein
MRIGFRLALVLAAAVVVYFVWRGCAPDEPEPPSLHPWSVQLHVHGSFSEGLASMESHSYEATDVGLDAIWWSDHDWRLTTYHTLSRFSFEDGPIEQDRAGDWILTGGRFTPNFRPELREALKRRTTSGFTERTSERAFEGAHSFQVSSAWLGPEYRDYVAYLAAPMPGFRRPLAADLTLRLALWPDGIEQDALAWIEVKLSEHAPREDEHIELEQHVLRYVFGSPALAPYREYAVYWIPLEHEPRTWNELALPITKDAAEGFPFTDAAGLDDSLTGIAVGLQTRNGQAGTVFVDDIVLEQGRRGAEMFERQREAIDAVAADYPNLRQLQGVEVSYLHPHLNEFSVDTELLDYDALAADSGLLDATGSVGEAELAPFFARRAVERAHARGGLVSFNHFLGTDPEGREPTAKRDEVLKELLEHRLYGADLIEVGYRDRGGHSLRDHLWAWDQLALRAGLRPVGIGVSDHHGGPLRWRTMANNFVSWILAPSPEKADLIDGLRAGRVWFGDITQFDGTLALTTDGGAVMGQEVVTDRSSVTIDVAVDGLEATDRVILVESGELTEYLDAEGPSYRGTFEVALPDRPGSLVRVECIARDGTAHAFSNPIHFLREVPEGGLDEGRAAIDFAGVRSRRIEGFRLQAVKPVSGEGWSGLRIVGRADGGTLVLDATAWGSVRAELKDFEGTVKVRKGVVTATGLKGSGRLVLKGRADP